MKLTRGHKPAKTTADAFMKARRDILETIQRIPRGKVASYSGVAFAAGWPGRARLVARVLSDVPRGREPERCEAPLERRAAPAGGSRTHCSASTVSPPEYEGLPWQRVINAQGKIAIPKGTPGHLKQIRLLKAEGVVFLNGRVSFAAHGWQLGNDSPLLD